MNVPATVIVFGQRVANNLTDTTIFMLHFCFFILSSVYLLTYILATCALFAYVLVYFFFFIYSHILMHVLHFTSSVRNSMSKFEKANLQKSK